MRRRFSVWENFWLFFVIFRERTLREQQEINRKTMERKEKERQRLEQEKRKEKEEEEALEQVRN